MAADQLSGMFEGPQLEPEQVALGAEVGQFIALVSISRSLLRVARALEKIADEIPPHEQAASLNLHVVDTPRKENPPMPPISPVSLDLNHNVALTVSPVDDHGNLVPDTLTWSVDNGLVLHLQVAPDGLSCLAVTNSAGTATVTVTDGTNTDSVVVTVTATPVPVALGLHASVVNK